MRTLLFVCISFCLHAQNSYSGKPLQNSITLAIRDTVYVFYVSQEKIKAEARSNYICFAGGVIQQIQGNYSGKLLDGGFEKFDRNNHLLEKGQFDNGLKTGTWQQWYESGKLSARYVWKKGVLSGKFEEYYPNGIVMRSGTFVNGKLHGPVALFADNGSLMTKDRFKHGELIGEKDRNGKAGAGNTPAGDSSATTRRGWFRKKNKQERAMKEGSEVQPDSVPDEKPVRRSRKKKPETNPLPQPNEGLR